MAIFTDVYENGGYIEFAMGYSAAPNNPSWSGTTSQAGGAFFDDFYLVVELEDTTPDATPPSVEYDGHYTGVTSYIEGARTLYLSLMDTNNPIDTTTANGPKLHYSTDGGNTYTVASAVSTGTCFTKNQVCGFAAETSALESGTTVDYYWTYSDAAANDNTKIPPQTPNPGRFPAAGAADLQFTIASVYDAPTDGSAMKLVTLAENTRSSEPHASTSSLSFASDVDRQMTYYTDSGEFHFEFGLDRCGANFPTQSRVPGTDGQGNCFFDYNNYPSFGEEAGHWDINWEGIATSCYPGATGCLGAPTNNLELAAHFGGPLGISGLTGAGNLVMVYDPAANAWMISGTGTGIGEMIDSSSMSDVNSMGYTSNVYTPPSPPSTTSTISTSITGAGGLVGTFTVPSGQFGVFGITCVTSNCFQDAFSIRNPANGQTESYGPTRHSGGGGPANNPVPSSFFSYGPISASFQYGGFESVTTGNTAWTNAMPSNVRSSVYYSNTPLSNNGIFPAGTYQIYHWNHYGAGSGNTILAKTATGFVAGGPVDTNLFYGKSGTSYPARAFVLDLTDSSIPALGPNSGFGGVPFGTAAGEFNKICVTSSGHTMFMESTSIACTPDAVLTSSGGQWQGFALGASEMGMQYNNEGIQWQIRNIQPDPDTSAPSITGAEMGDSHALDRTITITLSDNGVYDTGIQTSPVPGLDPVNNGPTAHVTITSTDGSVTNSMLALNPDGDRNDCALATCEWSADINNLARGDVVSYYITASDAYPPAPNQLTTPTYSFTVANPTNTLVVEWHEYAYSSSASQPCSMQVIMYDVTNEFEFHYDDDCYVDDIVGLVGVREDRTNVLQVRNDPTSRSGTSTFAGNLEPGNPHTNNIRFTLTDSGDYAYEYFDRGLTFLPLVSSDQTIPVRSTTFSNDNNCDSNADFANYGTYCAGNFDIPDDFDFEFYGQNFDGDNADNRIHVTGSGMLYFIDNGDVNTYRHETSWNSNGAMYDLDTTSTLFPDMMMSPWWSRETMDYCYSSGSRTCEGVWYRTLPYDGQGKTVTADITDDTTWYVIDSPIKVNPTDPSGYLSVTADLTIEPGVEVIMAENTGISFDGGLQADGTCAKFTAVGTAADRITFNADRSVNSNALWHGLAFTDDCGGSAEDDRHTFDKVDFSNTNHAAITAGSRPADPNGPSCSTSTKTVTLVSLQ